MKEIIKRGSETVTRTAKHKPHSESRLSRSGDINFTKSVIYVINYELITVLIVLITIHTST